MFALNRAWTDGLLSDVGCARPWLNTSLPRPLFENEERAFLWEKRKKQENTNYPNTMLLGFLKVLQDMVEPHLD
jgi:hypothetical protein